MTAGRLLDGPLIAIPGALLALGIGWLAARSPLLLLAVVGTAALTYLVLAHAEAVMLVLVAVLPWEALLRFPTETVTVVKLLGLLLLLAYLLRVFAGRAPLQAPATVIAAICFTLLVALSFVVSPDPTAGIEQLLRYALFAGFFFLVVQLADGQAGVTRVLRTLILSLTLAAAWTTAYFLEAEPIMEIGDLGDRNDVGFLLATALPLAAWLFSCDRRRRRLWGACIVVLVAGLLATLSRGALAGLAAVLVWAVLTRRVSVAGILAGGVVLLSVAMIALTAFAPVVDERLEAKEEVASDNASSRLALWSGGLYMAADNPLTGVGPGRYGEEGSRNYIRNDPLGLDDPVAHNMYVEILAESGGPALLAFLAFLGLTGSALLRARQAMERRDDAPGARLATALEGSLVVAAVAGFFISAQVIVPVWLIAALAAVLQRAASEEPAERPATAAGRLTPSLGT